MAREIYVYVSETRCEALGGTASCTLIVQLLREAKACERSTGQRKQSESGPGADRSFHVNTLSHSTLAPPPFIATKITKHFRLARRRVVGVNL